MDGRIDRAKILRVSVLAVAALWVAMAAGASRAEQGAASGTGASSDSSMSPVGGATPEPLEAPAPRNGVPPGRFVAEVIDSTYFVEPAEFFALDLPVISQNGAQAAHILGDVSVVGGRHDIIVRLFRPADYQNWLKRRGGRQAGPIWSSPRQRSIHLDQELPEGNALVLLLDNGYSLRTPKRVRVQIQLQYLGEPGAQSISAQQPARPEEGDIVPRSNSDDEFPPPPPPPSDNSK